MPGSGAEAAAELKDLRESLADTQVRAPMLCAGCVACVPALTSVAWRPYEDRSLSQRLLMDTQWCAVHVHVSGCACHQA